MFSSGFLSFLIDSICSSSGFLSFLIDSICPVYSMPVEMVACIAIEAISILEKMHSKGYLM